jgi:F-type H+-transporting ATPase subunit delta
VEAQGLARNYATAVFSQALEKWLTALGAVQTNLANDATLLKNLQDSSQPFSQRQQALDKIIPGDSDQYVRNYLYAMLKADDLGLLNEVIAELERMIKGGPQIQVARVTTAFVLSEDDKEKFRQRLQAKYGDIELVFNVDASLIGGAIVQVGDKVIDGSVATRLEAMGNRLGVK